MWQSTRARKGVLIGTSNVPSRFLDEIRNRETESIMQPIQELACGNAAGAQRLLDSINSSHLPDNVLQNLTLGYLADLGQSALAQQIQQHCLAIKTVL